MRTSGSNNAERKKRLRYIVTDYEEIDGALIDGLQANMQWTTKKDQNGDEDRQKVLLSGALLRVKKHCYEHNTCILTRKKIDKIATIKGFADALLACELAKETGENLVNSEKNQRKSENDLLEIPDYHPDLVNKAREKATGNQRVSRHREKQAASLNGAFCNGSVTDCNANIIESNTNPPFVLQDNTPYSNSNEYNSTTRAAGAQGNSIEDKVKRIQNLIETTKQQCLETDDRKKLQALVHSYHNFIPEDNIIQKICLNAKCPHAAIRKLTDYITENMNQGHSCDEENGRL